MARWPLPAAPLTRFNFGPYRTIHPAGGDALLTKLVIGVRDHRDKGPLFELERTRPPRSRGMSPSLNAETGQRSLSTRFENLLINCAQ